MPEAPRAPSRGVTLAGAGGVAGAFGSGVVARITFCIVSGSSCVVLGAGAGAIGADGTTGNVGKVALVMASDRGAGWGSTTSERRPSATTAVTPRTKTAAPAATLVMRFRFFLGASSSGKGNAVVKVSGVEAET